MYLNKFSKLYYLFFLFIFFNCHSSQNQSFIQLESALINWYYKYNPTIATEHNLTNYHTQLEKFDGNSIDEYKADINRFMIELSQIDETKLKEEYLIKYLVIDKFLFQMYNDIQNFDYYSHDSAYFLQTIYNSLFFIIYNQELDMNKKVNSILSRLKLIPGCMNHIRNNLNYYSEYNINQSLELIDKFQKLLNNLPLSINSDSSMLDEIDINIIKVKEKIKSFKNYISNNMDVKNQINKQVMIDNYLLYNKDISLNLDYNKLIQELYENMIDISLPFYIINNDEPVWAYREDTLKIINTTLKEFLADYPPRDEIIMSLNESLNRINSFSAKITGLTQNINYNHEIIISDDIYLGKNKLYKSWYNKEKFYLFLNRDYYYKDDLLEGFNQYKLDLYNIKNYFPGKYAQLINSRTSNPSINNIVINEHTNAGWGLLAEYLLIKAGYGNENNNIYMLIHLQNVLDSVIENMIFYSYYIDKKSKDKILIDIYDLTLYDKDKINKILSDVINGTIKPNVELTGYFEFKKMYNKLIQEQISYQFEFYSILLKNIHLSPLLIKQNRFNQYE